jgi:hypothetical protein
MAGLDGGGVGAVGDRPQEMPTAKDTKGTTKDTKNTTELFLTRKSR